AQVLGRGDYLKPEFHPATKRSNSAPNPPGVSASRSSELANAGFDSWTKESYEIATKIASRNGGRIGTPRSGNADCAMVAAAPVLPAGYVVSAGWIADRRMILAGYRLADMLTQLIMP